MAIQMPVPKSKYAPHFKGQDHHVRDFVSDFEAIAASANLTNEQKCLQVGRYAKKSVKELWENLPAFTDRDWDQYKAAILALYPEDDDTHKFSAKELVKLVNKQRKQKMSGLKAFSTYDRHFRRISQWLKKANLMAETEADRLYWDGIHHKFRGKVNARLQIKHPDHDPVANYAMSDIRDAALYVLKGRQPSGVLGALESSDSDEGSSSDESSDEEEDSSDDSSDDERTTKKKKKKAPKAKVVQVKQEPLPANDVKDLLSQIHAQNEARKQEKAEMTQAFEHLKAMFQAQQSVLQAATNRPAYIPLYNGPRSRPFDPDRPQTCGFCGLPGHYTRECMTAMEYINTGRAKKDATGRLTTPSGGEIPFGIRGQTLKGRLDDHLSKLASLYTVVPSPSTNSQAQTNLLKVRSINSTKGLHTSTAFINATVEDEGQEDSSVDHLVAALRADTQMKEDGPAMNTRSKGPAQPLDQHKAVPQTLALPPEQDSQPPGPRYQYKSRAEDQNLIDELVKMILENKLRDVTTAHIFAASPPVRSYLINYLRSHRVEVNNLMDCNKRNGSNLMVAEDSLRLREIEVVLNHKVPIKATIDDGSQIITLREDVWR